MSKYRVTIESFHESDDAFDCERHDITRRDHESIVGALAECLVSSPVQVNEVLAEVSVYLGSAHCGRSDDYGAMELDFCKAAGAFVDAVAEWRKQKAAQHQ
jgi:hypothetical protein